LGHIREAFAVDDTFHARPGIVINCTGILASKLGGVNDGAVHPVRGQLVIVGNESHGMYTLSGAPDMDERIGECCYIIDRPAGMSIHRNYELSNKTYQEVALPSVVHIVLIHGPKSQIWL
jgi:hypothetical protein